MKIKTQLTLASVIAAGLLASGCSQQMVAQQSASAETVPATVVETVVDCSSCNKPTPRPSGNLHGHPAVPGCTDSVKHNHPHPKGGNHSHKYSCKKPMMKPAPRPAPKPAPRPAPKPKPVMNPDAHTHPAVPNCTNSVRHVHANGRNAHNHRYACQKPAMRPVVRPTPRPIVPVQQPVPVMPKVKAKGTYRGPIKIDGVMKQYQQ